MTAIIFVKDDIIQTYQPMQKYLITPQKKSTPELKQLTPLPTLLSLQRTIKLEILHSPVTPSNDLFHQLLLVEHTPHHLNFQQCHPLYDIDFDIIEESQSSQNLDRKYQDDFYSEGFSMEENDQDQSGLKKRKRKSTAQIKILKAELDSESNWNKEKIAEMSDKTGLSQSQVYKWWWDQKNKNIREERAQLDKRKMIRKETFKRGLPYDKNTHGYYIDESLLTKPKSAIDIEEAPATERKINVRLVFL